MKLRFSTPVDGHFLVVFEKFDLELFDKLQPPFIPTKIEKYDGNNKGDEVHLDIGLPPLKQKWVSLITDHQKGQDQAFFTDEGTTLPFPLTFWKHQHIVLSQGKNKSLIIDSIEFKAVNKLLELIIFPAISSIFLLRKPVYKSFFKSRQNDTSIE